VTKQEPDQLFNEPANRRSAAVSRLAAIAAAVAILL